MEQKIDIEQTSERFITNLIRECTYLSGEKVLPKQSLLYESYCVLNEINNLRIHGTVSYTHLNVIVEFHKKEKGIYIISSHDIECLQNVCDKCLLLHNGQIREINMEEVDREEIAKILSERCV